MAKNWTLEVGTVLVRRYQVKNIETEKYEEVEPQLDLEMIDLFPEFKDMTDCQQQCILNGVKQKMDDSIARSKDMTLTEGEKRQIQEDLWNQILSGEWNKKEKKTGERGESVSLKLVVPALLAGGLSAEGIATMLKKKLEVIQKFIETGEEN